MSDGDRTPGSIVPGHWSIRPRLPRDREAERAFIESLSLSSRRYEASGEWAGATPRGARLGFDERAHEVAFVAFAPGGGDRLAGIARYAADAAGRHCECSVTLADDCEDEALGVLLMARLAMHARACGIGALRAIDDRCRPLLRLFFAAAGFSDCGACAGGAHGHRLVLQESPKRRA